MAAKREVAKIQADSDSMLSSQLRRDTALARKEQEELERKHEQKLENLKRLRDEHDTEMELARARQRDYDRQIAGGGDIKLFLT